MPSATVSQPTANPLLDAGPLPAFTRISAEQVRPAIDSLLAGGRSAVTKLLAANAGSYTWDNLIDPLETLDDRLDRTWSPVSHLHSVADQAALRDAYNACLPLLSDYATERRQNHALYDAYRSIAEGPRADHLDAAQRKVLSNALRDFRLAGVALPENDKARFKKLSARLTELGSRFEENLLDATRGWRRHLRTREEVAGIPASALAVGAADAAQAGLDGWLFGLDHPSYHALVGYADDRELRRAAYTAYVTRASDQGPNAGRWDNTPVMEEMLALRHEQARLLGFESYAHLSLERKMARDPGAVLELLGELASRARPVAEAELAELRAFARDQRHISDLQAWDLAYFTEQLRVAKFALAEEELRAYFPVPRVLEGLFELSRRLFGVRIDPQEGVDTWDPGVRVYAITDAQGELRGRFYVDLYARTNKRGGAWMDECVVRRRTRDGVQIPASYLTCNFSPPTDGAPAHLTHDQVTTLFHEFGHTLHHLLSRVDYAPVSGINGVAWDAVEVPSQLLEHWCWEPESLALISAHRTTDEPLPGTLIERLRDSRNFHSGLRTLRQVELALIDLRLHLDYDPVRGARIAQTVAATRREVAVITPPEFNRFMHGFSHIFGGGYAAGYYGYKWAEVLACDAYSRFEERGVLDPRTGRDFLHAVLEPGGTRDALDLFKAFRGREPKIDALFRHDGLATAEATA